MIERIAAFLTSAGVACGTLEEAQEAELTTILMGDTTTLPISNEHAQLAAAVLVENKDLVVDILTTTKNSRPRGRKINGAKRSSKKPSIERPHNENPAVA